MSNAVQITIPDLDHVETTQFLWGLFAAIVGVKFADGLVLETAPMTPMLRYRLAKAAILDVASNFSPSLRAKFEVMADGMAWEMARGAGRSAPGVEEGNEP